MKKFLTSIVLFFSALFLASCGIFSPSSSQNGGSGSQGIQSSYREAFECEYDGLGRFNFKNFEGGEIKVEIDGKVYDVKESSFDLNTLSLYEGRYVVNVYYYYNGQIEYEMSNEYIKGDENKKEGFRIAFFNHDGSLIKEIYVPKGTIFETSLFPSFENKTGVTYSWAYEAKLNSMVEGDIEVKLEADYVTYTITYHLNGGELEDALDSYNVGIGSYYFNDPAKSGFVFEGWYENSAFNGEKIECIDVNNPKNYELYAKWIELTADAKAIIEVLENTLDAKTLTVTASYEKNTYEMGYDISNGVYYYSKTNGKMDYVVDGDIYYDYSDMTYYKAKIDKDNYRDPLSLSGLISNIKEVSVKTSGTTSTYSISLLDSEVKVSAVVKDGILSELTYTYGNEKETYKVKTSCEKVSVDKSKFSEKIFVYFYILEIRKGQDNYAADQGRYDVKAGTKLLEVENITKFFENVRETFGGFYLDKDMTKPIGTDYVINDTVEIYAANYGNFEEVLEVYEFTLNVHCDCKDCKGVVNTYKDITFKELNEVRHFEVTQDGMILPFRLIEEGKEIMGWFKSSNKDEGEAYIPQMIYDHLSNGKFYEDLVIDVYSHTSYIETVKVKEYCGCDLHKGEYNEIIVPKGSWYWLTTNKHELEGYMCNQISLKEDLSELADGFEIHEDSSVYFKWILDTRVKVKVNSPDDKTGEGYREYYMEQDQLYEIITQEYSGMHNNMMVSGFYMDKAYTIPFTKDTLLKDGDTIYLKWTPAKEVTFVFYDGTMERFILPEDFDLLNYDWDQYVGKKDIVGRPKFQDQIFNSIYYHSTSYDFVSLFEFYTDDSRTTKITSLKGRDTVYVGYKNHPTVTIVCDPSCPEMHNPYHYWLGECYYSHQINEDGKIYDIKYYLDPEFTQEFSKEYEYHYEDFTIYGRKELCEYKLKINCGCFLHPNGIEGKFNSLVEAVQDCDYGYNYTYFPQFYKNKEYTEPFYFGEESAYLEIPELYAKVKGTVTVYCDCGIEGHDGKGFKLGLIDESDDGSHRVYEYLSEIHREAFMGMPVEYNVYLGEDKEIRYEPHHLLKDGDKLYCEIIKDPNIFPVTIYYADYYIAHDFGYLGDYINLMAGFDQYVVTGFYLDEDLTIPAPVIKGDGYYKIEITENLVIYCETKLADKAIFTYKDPYEGEVTTEIYLVFEYAANNLYSYLNPEYGYISYVVDENGNKVDSTSNLGPGVYKEYTYKPEDYVTITIECECHECKTLYGGNRDTLENGDIIGRSFENQFIIKKGECIINTLNMYYSFHDNYQYYFRDMIISLTKDGEDVDKRIFEYYDGGEIPDDITFRFEFEEDTTLYFRIPK